MIEDRIAYLSLWDRNSYCGSRVRYPSRCSYGKGDLGGLSRCVARETGVAEGIQPNTGGSKGFQIPPCAPAAMGSNLSRAAGIVKAKKIYEGKVKIRNVGSE